MNPEGIAALICSFVALTLALWNARLGVRQAGLQRRLAAELGELRRDVVPRRSGSGPPARRPPDVEVEVWRRRVELQADEARRARVRLRRLGAVARRLRVTVDRLVTLSRQLDDDAMVAETAEALDLIAAFLTASREERRIEFPAEVAERAGAVRVTVTELLLDLELRQVRRAGQASEARLKARANALAIAVAELREAITRRVAPAGEPEQDPDEDEPPLRLAG